MKKQFLFRITSALVVALGLFLTQATAHATTYTWTGASNQDWNRASNWKPTGVPTSTDTAIVGSNFDVRSSKTIVVAGISFQAGTRVSFSKDVIVNGALTLNSVDWTGSGDLTVNGPLTLSKTTLDGSGNLTFNGPIVASNSTISNGKTFTINGTCAATDCTFTGSGLFVISPKATLKLMTNAAAKGVGNVIDREFSNAGTVIWYSGDLVVNETFTNTKEALVELQSSGKLSGKAINSFFSNTGTIKRDKDGATSTLDIPCTNTGLLQVDSGTLEFTQALEQTEGECSLNGGTITSKNGVKIKGGVLDGTGTINGDVSISGGNFRPGHSPGSIVINGNYTQAANGTLDMDLGGTTAGTSYDQLIVNGTASLAGTLNLVPYGGYTPAEGTNFQLLEYFSLLGSFTTVHSSYPANVTFTTAVTPIFLVATAHLSSDHTSPTVAITTPVANAAYTTLTSANGTAADNVAVTADTVQLYRYGTAATPAGYWAGGNTWTTSYTSANERPATGTTSWSVALPTLPYGAYLFRPIAKDAAGNISNSSGAPFLKTTGTSAVTASSGLATASTHTIRLNFTAPIDSVIAVAPARYSAALSPSGQKVTVQSVTYTAATNSVTLNVASGVMVSGGKVIVTWTNLFDTTGKLMKGKTGALTIQ